MIWPLYSLAGMALEPLLPALLRRRAARGKEEAVRMGERFGHAGLARPAGRLVWLHAASMGETQSVLQLIRRLLDAHPALHVLITTGTVTSAQLVARQSIGRLLHQYVPVDTPGAVRRFLAHWRPDLALWVESEFWPQLLLRARRHGIPLVLVNARMSARSAARWQRWPRHIRQLLDGFCVIFAGDTTDAARLRALGAAHVEEVGNLKFDAPALPGDAMLLADLRAQIGMRACWLAASTHAPEEATVATLHRRLAAERHGLLTLLVPRHAARGNEIAAMLRSMGLHVAQRSAGEAITAATEIYLADTMGELGSFYRLAPVIFLGGSLAPIGGHNPLEPALLDCAVVTGPHLHNFAAISRVLQRAQAISVTADAEAVERQLQQWLADPALVQAVAERARRTALQGQGAAAAILSRLEPLLREKP